MSIILQHNFNSLQFVPHLVLLFYLPWLTWIFFPLRRWRWWRWLGVKFFHCLPLRRSDFIKVIAVDWYVTALTARRVFYVDMVAVASQKLGHSFVVFADTAKYEQ